MAFLTLQSRRSTQLRAAVLLALALSQSGCYLGTAAWEEAKILARRRPIADLVNDRRVDAATRGKLELVLGARNFAQDSIALDARESFTAFSQLDRDTLVLVVSAAHRDRLESYTWSFPIVGRVPYKGYFNFGAARREERDLAARGLDTYLRPADAFSTLGWFNDPLLSTTLARDSLELVNTVIHELTHNTFYAPGSAEFNESFATFVGSRGTAAFFRARGQPEMAERAEARWEDEKVLGAFWAALADSLESAFARYPSDTEARLRVRDTVYASARRALIEEIAPRLRTIHPSFATRVPLNNAWLLARRVYGRELGLFDRVWELESMDMRLAVRRIVQLARSQPEAPFDAVREWVAAAGGGSATPTVFRRSRLLADSTQQAGS